MAQHSRPAGAAVAPAHVRHIPITGQFDPRRNLAWETPTTRCLARAEPMVPRIPDDRERRLVMTSPGGQQGSRLDPWTKSYARRTAGMTTSEIRALFAVASRPEVVSLAGGMPSLTALPMDAIADTVV